jgi:hypothetical protein
MEGMLAEAFIAHAIQPSAVSAKYARGGAIWECDLAIETDAAIILLELKKKSLTAKSYAGHTLHAILDLCFSALQSQEQLGRHELALRENGRIEFLNGTVIEWRDRRIERVSVSLFDWGGTQDSALLRQVGAILTGATVTATEMTAKQAKDLEVAQETLLELQVQRERLIQLGVDVRQQIGSWWFLSVPQLLFALHGISGAAAFYQEILPLRAMITGTMDFYADLSHLRALRKRNASASPR